MLTGKPPRRNTTTHADPAGYQKIRRSCCQDIEHLSHTLLFPKTGSAPAP